MKTLTGLADPVTLDGVPIEPIKVTLSRTLMRAVSPDPAIAMDIALRIRNSNGKCELDDDHFKVLDDAVRGDQATANFAKAAMLDVLSRANVLPVKRK